MMQPVLTPTGPDWLERIEDLHIAWLQVLGRLPREASLEAAQSNMDAISAALLEEFPPPQWTQEGQGVTLSPHYQYEPSVRDSLVSLTQILMVVVGLVLLIACANVAILLLARASARRAELGIQVALGARRGRVVRQLLVESLLLTLLGGLGGYVIAFWSSDLAAKTFPFTFGIAFEPDGMVLAFTMIVAAGAALLFGTVPALLASRSDVSSLIKSRDSGANRSPLRRVLVVAQVALSTVLVIGSVQFVRSLRSAEAVDLGFETERRLLVSLNLTSHGYETSEMGPFIESVLERLEALPGVVRASTTLHTPFRGQWTGSFVPEGAESEEESERASFNAVGPGYFRTMGIPVITGRDFTKADDAMAAQVIIMSEAAARKYWPDGDWIGRTISGAGSETRRTVIGVVRDANYHELGEEPVPRIYLSALQPFMSFMGRVNFLVQTAGDPLSISGLVQNEIYTVDPDIAITSVMTMKDCVERVIGRYRVGATVVGLFGILALALAAIGLYGVLSYLVVRRTRAIGIQMALGATQSMVARSVVGEGFKLALVGIALGIPLALVAVDFIESFLYGIEPKDPTTFSVVPLVLAAVACLAAFLPARRASRVNPIDALREE
jgi:predicted permease